MTVVYMGKLIAFFSVVFCMPLLLFGALIVLITLGRPIFFQQERLGQGGEKFHLIKFRSMKGGDKVVISEADYLERTTKLTRLLRTFKLDELPQLFNVLNGDINFFGPRPLSYDYYKHPLPKYKAMRLSVKPGILGLSQVLGLDHTEARRRLAGDILYVKKSSAMLRLQIFIMLFWRFIKPISDNPTDDLYMRRQEK